jgi:hypothetical protein
MTRIRGHLLHHFCDLQNALDSVVALIFSITSQEWDGQVLYDFRHSPWKEAIPMLESLGLCRPQPG